MTQYDTNTCDTPLSGEMEYCYNEWDENVADTQRPTTARMRYSVESTAYMHTLSLGALAVLGGLLLKFSPHKLYLLLIPGALCKPLLIVGGCLLLLATLWLMLSPEILVADINGIRVRDELRLSWNEINAMAVVNRRDGLGHTPHLVVRDSRGNIHMAALRGADSDNHKIMANLKEIKRLYS